MAKAPVKKKAPAKPAKKVVAKKAAPVKKATVKVAKPAKKVVVKVAKPIKKVVVKVAKPIKKVVVKVAKPAKVAKPVKPIKVPEVKKTEPKIKAKIEKELKVKGKKGKEEADFDEEVKPRKSDDEDEDDDLFSEKKNAKNKPTERIKKEEIDLTNQKVIILADYFKWSEIQPQLETLEFFLPKDDACMQRLCENIRTTGPYCRLHYIANWKLMQRKKEILKEGKLQALVEEFATKYAVNFINAILDDLDSDREFHKVLTELNISDAEFDLEEAAVVAEEEEEDTIDFESRNMDTFKPGGFEEE